MRILLIIFGLLLISCGDKKAPQKTKEIYPKTQINETKKPEVKEPILQEKQDSIPQYSEIKKPKIKEKDYIDFFNQILDKNGLILNEKIEIFPIEFEYLNDNLLTLTKDKILNLNDIKFISEQAKIQKNIKLSPRKINRKKIERKILDEINRKYYNDLETYWKEIYKYGDGYYNLELPLFSIDKTIAILRYSYSCGSLCANTGTYIFKLTNGKWERIGNIGIEIVS